MHNTRNLPVETTRGLSTMLRRALIAVVLVPGVFSYALAGPPAASREPIVRTVDLNIGQSQEVRLADGKRVTVKLLDL